MFALLVFSCQPFSTLSALTGTLTTAFYVMTVGQTSTGGTTFSHSTMVYFSSRHHLGSMRVLSKGACNSGADGYFNAQFFHTPFPGPILHFFCQNINILELLAIMAALKLWGPALCVNNSVLALNSSRSRTLGLQLCLCEIWFLSVLHDFHMTAVNIPGCHKTLSHSFAFGGQKLSNTRKASSSFQFPAFPELEKYLNSTLPVGQVTLKFCLPGGLPCSFFES